MKTNNLISKSALENAYAFIVDVQHLTNEIVLTVKNTPFLWGKLVSNRRSKIHSIAFYALFEIVRVNAGKPAECYYVSNNQIKKFIEKRFGHNLEKVLADACNELQSIRNKHL